MQTTARKRITLSLLLATAILCGGCGSMQAIFNAQRLEDNLATVQKIERADKIDRLRFLEKVSDAYFLIGLEYYTLAREAEAAQKDQKARDYATKASLYNLFSRDIKATAENFRASLQVGEPDNPQFAPRQATAPTAPRRETPPPAWDEPAPQQESTGGSYW